MKQKIVDMRDCLVRLSAIGAAEGGGLTRLLYSPSWRQAQDCLGTMFEEIGLAARFDPVGNLFGRIEGREKPEETVLTGSHVDTVRNGGTLDGQYGILAAWLAVDRLMKKHGRPKSSIELVSFAEEEGSRFPYAFWGSKNLVGVADREVLRQARDAEGHLFPEAMRQAGFDFEAARPAPRKDIKAFVEAHIEQGGVLENLGQQIGVVTDIAGQKRYTVTLTGEANHAGTTPMSMRHDAVEGAARCMVRLLDQARTQGDPLVLTFGKLEVLPNIVNVVPGRVVFTVDCRHTDQTALDAFARTIESAIARCADDLGLTAEIDCWMNEPPVPMNRELVERIARVCREQGLKTHVMHSGAGHDSQILARHYPTAMFFVPSIKGISHNPAEETKMEDLVAGVDALEAILYDLAY
ncbi:MAG: allantoate deiminase [Candidatus Accumulibacter sp.]|jgi:allantoate deiminase|nr:allantoate deiminase [Accumulibacter sp.]